MSELTPERWQKIKDIYNQLADCSQDEWRHALPQLCEGDEELQRDMEHYLELEIGPFLKHDSQRPQLSHTEIFLPPGEVVAQRYRVLRLLGCGGMADVYEVEDNELSKQVALKVIRSDVSFDNMLLERFRTEVELAQLVRHRNVCGVYDIGHDHRGPRELTFLTMELIPGETMAERLRRSGPLDPSEWLPVAKQLCKALNEAHQTKVLHRDFKPGNVMLVGSGENIRAVVTDFGIASVMDNDRGLSLTLTAKYLIGTWLYMSPEQERGDELAATSDIYSLGLVLYEMLTGEPYRLCPQIERIPEHLGNWKRAIQRALEPDPAKRFESALEVLDAIKTDDAPPPQPTPDRVRPTWNRLWIAIATATACVLLIAAPTYPRRIPLPENKYLAFLLPQTGADQDLGIRARAWSQAAIRGLRHVRVSQGSLRVAAWDSVTNLRPEDVESAASTIGYNLYTVTMIKRQAGTINVSIELRQVHPKLQLRTVEFSVPESSNVDSVLAKYTADLLEVPEPAPWNCSSPVRAACDFYTLARGYLNQRDLSRIDLAIDNFQKAIEGDPRFAFAYADLALAYSLKYRNTHDPLVHGKAMQAYAKADTLDHSLPRARVALGLILQDTGTIAGAIEQFEQALSLDPGDSDVRSLLSMAYLKSGNMGKAKRLLEEAIELDPLDWFNYNDLGFLNYKNGELADAEVEFRKAVARAPDNTIANGVLGSVCICLGKYSEAESIANKILAFRKSAMAYENLALVYEHRGRYADALKMLQAATQRQPTFDFYWLELGDAFTLQGAKSETAKSYREALKQGEDKLKNDPNDRDLLSRLALYHAKLGQKGQALRELRQALTVAPNVPDPDLLLISARVYEVTGQRREALNVLRAAAGNKCIRTAVETIPDFSALRSDRQYTEIQPASL